ncbi:protein tyrosine/serine/threonine phosphatase [Aureococcus anophagefferens]|nr:protein tyrosine/serine/threonine phosphatase [Aureococcus anophagefferens]
MRNSSSSPVNGAAILPNRLYYVAVRDGFSIDDTLVYWNFFLDFGPLNLGQLYRFCTMLNAKLQSPELRDKVIY